MKPRILISLAIVAAAGTISYAAAATLGVTSAKVGAGRTDVPPCDSNGFFYTRTLDASKNIATVTVSGIDPSCAGGTLQLTLANAANASLGSGSAAVTGSGDVTVTIAGTAPAANVDSYRAAITG